MALVFDSDFADHPREAIVIGWTRAEPVPMKTPSGPEHTRFIFIVADHQQGFCHG